AVVYGIGIVPNAQLAIAAGLDADLAIKVNENCQTSNADIYAAGDVATQLREDGEFRRVETWENANLQAGIFARHVMGVAHPIASAAWFWTYQLTITFPFGGDMAATHWLGRGDMDAAKSADNSFVMYGVPDGQIVACIPVHAAKKTRHLEKMISEN